MGIDKPRDCYLANSVLLIIGQNNPPVNARELLLPMGQDIVHASTQSALNA